MKFLTKSETNTRNNNHNNNSSNTSSMSTNEFQDDEIKLEFNAAWPKIIGEVFEDPHFQDINYSLLWLKEVLEKNVPFGKQNRALLGIQLYRKIKKDRTEEDDLLSYVLGWCAEIMQCSALMADDIMDSSQTRRGKPCWYTLPEVGLQAVNDAFLLENFMYYILDKHFGKKEDYAQLIRHIQMTTFKTILGQTLDSRMSLMRDFTCFTIEKYEAIVKYKTSYYSFYAPAACAMVCAGIKDEKLFVEIEKVLLAIGYLFQVQDDYLDTYGDPKVTGKIGTDIIQCKCNWFIVKALELGSIEQQKILEENYGQNEKEVHMIYSILKLKNLYRKHEDETYRKIVQMIHALPPQVPSEPLLQLLNSIYKRES